MPAVFPPPPFRERRRGPGFHAHLQRLLGVAGGAEGGELLPLRRCEGAPRRRSIKRHPQRPNPSSERGISPPGQQPRRRTLCADNMTVPSPSRSLQGHSPGSQDPTTATVSRAKMR